MPSALTARPSAAVSASVGAPHGAGLHHPARRAFGFLRALLLAPTTLSLRAQVLAGTAFFLVLFVVLVALAVNGTSSGIHYNAFFPGVDPQRIALPPRAIRTDEYFVTTPLIIAQLEQGMPRFSEVYPGGLDMSILFDVPYREWSILLRPHSWGFFFLPLDNAFAFRWWLPALAMGTVAYALLCTLWRRPLAALAVSLAFIFSPFFQWWFGAGSFWPPTFGLALVLVTIWMTGSAHTGRRWVAGAAVAYLGLVAAVSLYPAFLVPSVLAGLAGAIGWFCAGPVHLDWAERTRRVAPLAAAGLTAGAVFVVYLSGRAAALGAIGSTLYPGDRSWPTGASDTFPWTAMYAGAFGQGLGATRLGGFAPNPSEGASFVFLGLYLLPVAAWLIASRWRRARLVDWALVALVACTALFAAFVYIPGWDALAGLVLLDTTTTPRIVIGFGLLSFLLLAVVVHRILQRPVRARWGPAAVAAGVVVASHVALIGFLTAEAPQVLAFTWWVALLPALGLAVLLFGLGRPTVAALLALGVSVAVCGWVNPLYRGVLDLRETDLGRAVEQIDDASPGTWVTTAGTDAVAVLRETAVESYGGTQGWPPTQMWRDLDPDGAKAAVWNRYAHVFWTTDPGAEALTNPFVDTIVVVLDTCGAFAQEHLDHVVTDEPLDQPCARLVMTVEEEGDTYLIYDVVAPTS